MKRSRTEDLQNLAQDVLSMLHCPIKLEKMQPYEAKLGPDGYLYHQDAIDKTIDGITIHFPDKLITVGTNTPSELV
jgi:hypothetical protein